MTTQEPKLLVEREGDLELVLASCYHIARGRARMNNLNRPCSEAKGEDRHVDASTNSRTHNHPTCNTTES
jgi:hypothetical protein